MSIIIDHEVSKDPHLTPETTNFQLIKWANSINLPLVVICKNELKKKYNSGNFIINLANSNKPGTHWVALKLLPNAGYYFDSFGAPPPIEIANLLRNRFIKINTADIQPISEGYCGEYCLLFLIKLEWADNKEEAFDKFIEGYTNLLQSDS